MKWPGFKIIIGSIFTFSPCILLKFYSLAVMCSVLWLSSQEKQEILRHKWNETINQSISREI